MKGTISEDLAGYILGAEFSSIPEDVIHTAKLSILDSIGCTMGGIQTRPGEIIIDVIRKLKGEPESTILGVGFKTNSVLASLVNSTLANALDLDDFYLPVGHPGATVVPPALAVGESVKASGREFITAVILGNEISIRIGLAVKPTLEQQKKVWGLGCFQTFGAVTAAAKLLDLDLTEMVNALGVAGANAPVPSVCKTVLTPMGSTMVKNNYGVAAQVGVLAALLAKSGFTGPRDIFDGDTGFWRMCGSDQCQFDVMTEGLGFDYKIRRLAFKPYPCCRWIHSPIDAALKIMARGNLNPSQIEKITVRCYSFCTNPPFDNYSPKSIEEAVFSTPYAVAAAILAVPLGEWYTEAQLTNPEILDLARKIELIEDDDCNRVYPEKMLAKVALRTEGGEFSESVDLPKGEPQDPMSEQDLIGKFEQVTCGKIPKKRVSRILKMILEDLNEIEDITELTQQLVFGPLA